MYNPEVDNDDGDDKRPRVENFSNNSEINYEEIELIKNSGSAKSGAEFKTKKLKEEEEEERLTRRRNFFTATNGKSNRSTALTRRCRNVHIHCAGKRRTLR